MIHNTSVPSHLILYGAFVENDVRRSLPEEGLGIVIPDGQPLVDSTLQLLNTTKGSAADHPVGDESEPTLHLIEPGTAGGREMEVESATFLRFEPFLHASTLVGPV